MFSDDFQPVLAMKFLVESEFQGQEPPRTQETTKTTGTIRIPRVGFGTDRPYIALFWANLPCERKQWKMEPDGPKPDREFV